VDAITRIFAITHPMAINRVFGEIIILAINCIHQIFTSTAVSLNIKIFWPDNFVSNGIFEFVKKFVENRAF
jgi:hypothetical protein